MKKNWKTMSVLLSLMLIFGLVTGCSSEDSKNSSSGNVQTSMGDISGLKSAAVSSSTVKLSWDYSSFAYFTVFYSKTDSFSSAKEFCSGFSEHYCEVDGLEEFTTYYFWVQAYYGTSKSRASRAPGRKTLLKAPSALASKRISTSINVVWTLQDKMKEGVRVYWGNSNNISSCTDYDYIQSPTTNYVISNLTRGKTYYVFVRSVASGNDGEYTLAGAIAL